MNAIAFLRKVKGPFALAPNLIFINQSDDFSPYLEEPDNWHDLTVGERILHATKFLHNAWRYHEKRRIFDVAVDRDSVLEAVFTTLCSAASKLPPRVKNPGGYLFTSVRNALTKEIEKQRHPIQHSDNLDDLFRTHDWALATAPFEWGSVMDSYRVLENCCQNETELAILYERWRKPSQGWLSPEWASVIAERLELPLAYVLNTLESIQARYVAAVNHIKKQRHERQIKPVPLSHISPGSAQPLIAV